jgi:hypothetical protein
MSSLPEEFSIRFSERWVLEANDTDSELFSCSTIVSTVHFFLGCSVQFRSDELEHIREEAKFIRRHSKVVSKTRSWYKLPSLFE